MIELVPAEEPRAMPDLLPQDGTPEGLRKSIQAAVYGLRVDLVELVSRKLDKSNELRTEQAAQARELVFIRKALASQSKRIGVIEEKLGIVPPQFRRRKGKGPRLPEVEQ